MIQPNKVNPNLSNEEISALLYQAYLKQNGKNFSQKEYREDLKRFVSIGKLLRRYKNGNADNLRLIINNMVVLFNCFDPYAVPVLHLYIEDDLKPELYAFLEFFSRLDKEKIDEGISSIKVLTELKELL